LSAVLCLAGLQHANAATIGISIPLSGDAAELGQKFRIGAKLAMERLGGNHSLFIADDGCDPDLATLAAQELKTANPAIIVGMICNAPAKSIVNHFAGSDVPAIVAGARSVRLIKDREREEWNLWRLSPGDDYPVDIAARAIAAQWPGIPYAIVDDGTIFGRNFTDLLRLKMDEVGLKPQFSDTFRAAQSTQAGLLRRLQRSGVTAAFIASASVEDLFTITSNMREFEIDLDIMTTEALGVLPFLEEAKKVPAGIQVVMAPIPAHADIDEILAERELEPDPQIFYGYASVQIALQVLEQGATDIASRLVSTPFDTVVGKVEFNNDGSSIHNPYQLQVWDGNAFVSASTQTETQ